MILERYLGKLFFIRLLLLVVGFLAVSLAFESIMAKKILSSASDFQRLPLILHKVFPFLVFLSVLLFLWRLIRFHELDALFSVGLSVYGVLRVPFFLVFLCAMGDLFLLSPLSQKLANPLKEKQGKVSLDPGGWQVIPMHFGYYLVRMAMPRSHLLVFTPESQFQRHWIPQSIQYQKPYLLFEKAWELIPNQSPRFMLKGQEYITKLPRVKNIHPGLMSFIEAHKALEGLAPQKALFLSRRDYLLSHALWIMTLICLAASVMIGSAYRRLLQVLLGIILCFVLYLIKEWLYAISFPLSYLWHPISLWGIPLLTFLIAFVVLFEKKEL